jgi:N utilization substance protein B
MSNRHLARSIVMQVLYQWDFRGKPTAAIPAIIEQTMVEFGIGLDENVEYVKKTIDGILEHVAEIDKIITHRHL